MRQLAFIVGAIIVSGVAGINAVAFDSVYTDTLSKCSVISKETNWRVWRCKGPAGYSAVFSDEGNVVEVQFGLTGGEKNLGQLQWPAGGDAIGRKVEWRLSGGVPIAAILRIMKRDESGRVRPYLLVAKVSSEGGCLIDTIDARLRGANSKARDVADARALAHKCGQ